jgi:SAM-dependent methyltransferase
MTIEQKIKDYWNAQPCNINHSKEPFGTVEYFDSVSAKRYKAEPHILDFAGFHLWRGKRVLEVGCGIGTDAEQFMRHGAEYTGIDISDESLRICEQRADVQGLKGKFINRSATENLENLGKFDLVYSYGVLHHYPNIEQSIQNIHDVINLNGEFRFMVYAKDSWKYSMIRKGLDQFEAQADCPYAEAFTRNEIELLLKDDFWKIERLRQAHCFMYNVEKYKKGIFEFEPWFESMSEVMREAVKEYLGWHLLVKTRRI